MRRSLILILWLVTDYCVFLASYAAAYFFRVGWIFSSDLPFDHYMTAVAMSALPWLALLIGTRTFGLTRNQRTPRNAMFIIAASVVGLTLVISTYFFLFQAVFSRMLALEALVLCVLGTFLAHAVTGLLMRIALRSGTPVFPTLIIGVTRETRALLTLLSERRSVLKPVAILDAGGSAERDIAGVPVMGKLNKLEDVLREHRITHVIQCSDLEQSINLLSACRAHGITYMLLPSVLGIVERDERVESLEGKAVTVVSPQGYWWNWFFR